MLMPWLTPADALEVMRDNDYRSLGGTRLKTAADGGYWPDGELNDRAGWLGYCLGAAVRELTRGEGR